MTEFDPDLERAIERIAVLTQAQREVAIAQLCAEHPSQVETIRALAGLHSMLSEDPAHPERIGPYRIVRTLGEGGMGSVFLAEQESPVRRLVAIKLIKLGMDSREVVARFEAERQALALMNHSSIAKVFDGGLTQDGRPFFVMEYVDGEPISSHCARHESSLHERLTLFRQVCAGVEHAHQKGVIHRDLKPTNLLVTFEDGEPVVKIIDFGLARATAQREVESTLYTLQGQLIGTPVYMSPEQAVAANDDIDTRTDVYSLGVVLYELLAGVLPFHLDDAGGDLDELRRLIREDYPARPSTRVSATTTNPDETRRRWLSSLRGDLDWVVMKALAKEPERRYQSAAEFGADIDRYLRHEPVSARPPGSAYHVRRFVRKHRLMVAAVTAVALALVIGTVTSIWFAVGASRARKSAETHLADFDHLKAVLELRDARRTAPELDPSWPDQHDDIAAWMQRYGEGLRRVLPELRTTVGDLEARALEWTAEEREADREAHPRYAEFVRNEAQLRWLRDSRAVRQGTHTWQSASIDPTDVPAATTAVLDLVRPLAGPGRTEYGRAAEALAIVRCALERGDLSETDVFGLSLNESYALLDLGDDEGARKAFARAFQIGEELSVPVDLGRARRYLEEVIELGNSAAWDHQIEELAAEVAALEPAIAARSTFDFADDRDAFLHEALREAISGIEQFLDVDVPRMEERAAWCRRFAEVRESHAKAWDLARDAIARADGETASNLYADSRIDLRPQPGLVPIGMNPVTRLWEFYDLRSAADPTVVPRHAADGTIEVTGETGIVFVLVPGGRTFVGEQSENSQWPNFSPQATRSEKLNLAKLDPFFLSRFELTRGQWSRLSRGEAPSFHNEEDEPRTGVDVARDRALPVEQVDWSQCAELMRRFRLELPTEYQWEVACRAGTTSRWSSGRTAESLTGFANVADRTAQNAGTGWATAQDIEDGSVFAAPVGSYAFNAFGLHDMHGNVAEWCRDTYRAEIGPARTGDGLHGDGPGPRVVRGGSFQDPPDHARSSKRRKLGSSVAMPGLGVRPARPVR
ncbi:MAG: SUMF1/EgtB/PvdO family nonheme iron enzyme [Planctomycetes bacterium]|nr:SUMF1/EgtB/PvdO family nonheme iron enzyme [Planctomycetota bacterium]